jgi:hypothetical protein
MLVSLNGVIQAPNTSFSVSGSTITFLPSSGTLSSSDSIDFIMVYGNVLDVGVATTVSDASITKAKMNLISDSSSAGLTIKGDGGSENGTLQLNCSQNSHGVKISSPAHSSGQSYELILPTGNVTADKVLKVASVSGSGATGIGQLSFGDAGGNTPAFAVRKTSSQTINHATTTKITWDNEVVDTDSAFASDKFTVPSGKGGNYLIYATTQVGRGVDSDMYRVYLMLYKNGSQVNIHNFNLAGTDGRVLQVSFSEILSLSAGDYLEIYNNPATSSGNNVDVAGGSTESAVFGGFKIG